MGLLYTSLEREDGCPTLGVMRQELDILLKVECYTQGVVRMERKTGLKTDNF